MMAAMTSATPLPLVIDTDTAQDDCVAILVGLLHPEVDLKGITMVAGNVGFDRQVANAFMTLSAAGRLGEVPVHLGCRRPLARPWISVRLTQVLTRTPNPVSQPSSP